MTGFSFSNMAPGRGCYRNASSRRGASLALYAYRSGRDSLALYAYRSGMQLSISYLSIDRSINSQSAMRPLLVWGSYARGAAALAFLHAGLDPRELVLSGCHRQGTPLGLASCQFAVCTASSAHVTGGADLGGSHWRSSSRRRLPLDPFVQDKAGHMLELAHVEGFPNSSPEPRE